MTNDNVIWTNSSPPINTAMQFVQMKDAVYATNAPFCPGPVSDSHRNCDGAKAQERGANRALPVIQTKTADPRHDSLNLAMADVFTKQKRSEVMAKIRSRGNLATELRMASLMRRAAIHGWRRHPAIFGRPDFAFKRERVAVFVDGCFWHCCPKCSNLPANNGAFWRKKLSGNVKRDKLVTNTLRRAGWIVIRFWEHEIPKPKMIASRIRRALAGR